VTELALPPDQRARLEARQFECPVVQEPPRIRICRQEDLETAIQKESVRFVRPGASTNIIRCFKDLTRNIGFVQLASTAETRQSSADKQYVTLGRFFPPAGQTLTLF
jgi:hypothetical protein